MAFTSIRAATLRTVVVGRNNSMFAGNDRRARDCHLLQRVATAKHCGANGFDYMRDLLKRLANRPVNHVGEPLRD
jgi:hypothetical protein